MVLMDVSLPIATIINTKIITIGTANQHKNKGSPRTIYKTAETNMVP